MLWTLPSSSINLACSRIERLLAFEIRSSSRIPDASSLPSDLGLHAVAFVAQIETGDLYFFHHHPQFLVCLEALDALSTA
jgi:hypothetical protein